MTFQLSIVRKRNVLLLCCFIDTIKRSWRPVAVITSRTHLYWKDLDGSGSGLNKDKILVKRNH